MRQLLRGSCVAWIDRNLWLWAPGRRRLKPAVLTLKSGEADGPLFIPPIARIVDEQMSGKTYVLALNHIRVVLADEDQVMATAKNKDYETLYASQKVFHSVCILMLSKQQPKVEYQ